MPPKPAAPAEAGSKQVKPKQKKAPAPKKTQPIKAKAVDYKSTIEAQWNTAAWRGKGHEEFDLQQVQKRAYFIGLQTPAVLSVASPSSSSSSSVSSSFSRCLANSRILPLRLSLRVLRGAQTDPRVSYDACRHLVLRARPCGVWQHP